MIFDLLFSRKQNISLLLDPDKVTNYTLELLSSKVIEEKINCILLGGSLIQNNINDIAQTIKSKTNLPVVLFPGNTLQICPYVDAILLLSLVSGRNPEYLIGQHVAAAPIIRNLNLETISTGYMLFDCGNINSVRYMSSTLPIPNNKPDIAMATAMAAEMLGLKTIYLEAGSGAEVPVSQIIISAVRRSVNIPIIVGGGLRNIDQISKAFEAGANMVVVGTAFEQNQDKFLSDLAKI